MKKIKTACSIYEKDKKFCIDLQRSYDETGKSVPDTPFHLEFLKILEFSMTFSMSDC